MISFMNFDLSLVTLLLFFVPPFAYYAYSAQLWYMPERIRVLNFFNILASLLLDVLVVARLLSALRYREFDNIPLISLHAAPPTLALLAIARGRTQGLPAMIRSAGTEPQKQPAPKPKALRAEQIDAVAWDKIILNDQVKTELVSVIELLKNPDVAKNFGIHLPKGILLSGPPGTGKTTIAKAMAATAGISFYALRADEITSKFVGESEKNLTALFEAAQAHAPAVVFIDEIDSIGKKRSDKSSAHSEGLLNHLLQLMDGAIKLEGIYVIGATNRPDVVDSALRRAGRLNRVIEIGLPDLESRRKLLELYTASLQLAQDVDLEALAGATEGNSPAEIKEICNQAGLHAFQRKGHGQSGSYGEDPYSVTSADVEAALAAFAVDEDSAILDEPSKPGPINAEVEKISWDDLIIDDALKAELQSVVQLLKDSSGAKDFGIETPKGILLYGPPGTGKTTLAKVIASQADLAFFVLQTNEIVSKWVGESEKNLTRLFKVATNHAPSVIFIDEIDSIAKSRSEGNAAHADNLLNHLLQLIDGVIKRDGIFVIAATNRPELVDRALTRGGRISRQIEIPLPGPQARRALFEMYLKKLVLEQAPNLDALVKATNGKSGADIRSICSQAGLHAFKRHSAAGSKEYTVSLLDIKQALIDMQAGQLGQRAAD